MLARDAIIELLEAGGGGCGGRPQREEGVGQLHRPHPCAVGRGHVSLLANSDAWDSKHVVDVVSTPAPPAVGMSKVGRCRAIEVKEEEGGAGEGGA